MTAPKVCYKSSFKAVNRVNPVNRTETEINPVNGILQALFTMNFDERMALILGDRKISPWGRGLGLSNSVIEQLNKGSAPGSDYLQIISRSENVNLNFLLNGQGSAFCVQDGTPDCILNWLNERSPAAPGFIHLVLCDGQSMLALESFEDIQMRSRVLEYTRFDLVSSPLDSELLATLKDQDDIRAIELPPTVFKQLKNGMLGAYACLGNDQENGLFKRYSDIPLSTIELKAPVQTSPANVIDIELMRAILEMVAEVTSDTGEILSEADHAKVTAALYNSALRDGLTVDSLQRGAVFSLLDMLQ